MQVFDNKNGRRGGEPIHSEILVFLEPVVKVHGAVVDRSLPEDDGRIGHGMVPEQNIGIIALLHAETFPEVSSPAKPHAN